MVGPWPLAPHHDLIMVFTSYTILMQFGVKIRILQMELKNPKEMDV